MCEPLDLLRKLPQNYCKIMLEELHTYFTSTCSKLSVAFVNIADEMPRDNVSIQQYWTLRKVVMKRHTTVGHCADMIYFFMIYAVFCGLLRPTVLSIHENFNVCLSTRQSQTVRKGMHLQSLRMYILHNTKSI